MPDQPPDQPHGTTPPSPPAPQATDAIARAKSFGAWAKAYDTYRPRYPQAAWQTALAAAEIPVRRVLDLGAGTGQLSSGLLAANPDLDVVALEPDERMRAVLAEVVGEDHALAGRAEAIPLPDASVDVVMAAQMWHWVDLEVATAEVARVLRPGGVLAILWNLRDDRTQWIADLGQQVPLADTYQWFKDHERPELPAGFGPIELVEYEHVQTTDIDGLLGLISTFSVVGMREDRDDVLATVREFAATHPQLAGEQVIEIPYVCKVFTAVRDR